jgi:modification methylase
MTSTKTFGTGKHENHDSSAFYDRHMMVMAAHSLKVDLTAKEEAPEGSLDKIYCQSSEEIPLPDNSVDLAFTSPPYNVGKDYDENLSMYEYSHLIERVGVEVFRVLRPGGRYVINVANLGRNPYLSMTTRFHNIHVPIGFTPMGEIIWQKGKGANGSCAWGSWLSAKAPRLRDLHEYLLVFSKYSTSRPDKGVSDITREEFMRDTLSVWEVRPESAKKIGHPAPFPLELARRVIKLYSYVGDVVLDPFCGSGTTCVTAKQFSRRYVGIDNNQEYCQLAERRLVV